MKVEPELDVLEALQRRDLAFIDVRSPDEFTRASIPGAVNIPLFDDDQHRGLGLLYHREGETAARHAALTMVSPRLPALVETVTAAAGSRIPLLYCWRGGLRSLSLYQILKLTGVAALRLKGGYRAFRRYVNHRLGSFRLESSMLVLHGLTGVGKTAVIEALIERGCPAIDLEGLACHRGSVFGAVGIPRQRSQKDFEALLLQQLERFSGSPCLVVEGEGKRIGNVHLPHFLVRAMEDGSHVLLTAPLAERVRRIVREYLPAEPSADDLDRIGRAIHSLSLRLGPARTKYLQEKLAEADYNAVAEILCTDYYDQFYADARPERRHFIDVIDTTELSRAAGQLSALLERLTAGQGNPRKGVLI